MTRKCKNQEGQTLIFVVATMAIALSVGVGVAVRNLSSISRSTRTDTSMRVQAVAEGGVEKYLSYSDNELDNLVSSTQIVGSSTLPNDNVEVVAEVTIDYYKLSTDLGYHLLNVENQNTSEVLINNDGVTICWVSTSNSDSELYLSVYGNSSEVGRIGLKPSGTSFGPLNPSYFSNLDTASGGRDTFTSCYDLSNFSDMPSSPTRLRITSLNGSSGVGIYPDNISSFPGQGYKITSVGKLSNSGGSSSPEVVVEVLRSFSHTLSLFDFAVVSGSQDEPININ